MEILLAIIIIVLVVVIPSIKIVPQAKSYVIERLGSYYKTWGNGLHFKIPFIDRIANVTSMKEIVKDFAPQPVITKDNVTMQIDTVVYYQITNPNLYTYGVENPINAIENLTATTLRNLIGELELDQTLTSRDIINSKMRSILDEATDPWGIKVNRVEVKNIIPPRDIQDAMEKQMRAERERREAILKAEGEKKSSVLVAEGEKEAVILRAQAEQQKVILAAEAQKAKLIAEAEGKAKAIELVNKASPNAAYLTLEGYDALKVMADGNATKIVVPSEIQNVSGLFTSLSEVVKTDSPKAKEGAKKEVVVEKVATTKKTK